MANIFLNKNTFLTILIIVFHGVGLVYISREDTFDYFASLSGWNLYLTFILFLISYNKIEKRLFFYFLFCFAVGMIFEWLGVHTGIVFGEYTYGDNLGYKVFGVPISIGINWIILTVSSANISQLVFNNLIIKSFFGALLMVILDFLIEQIAPKLDFWYWSRDVVPIYNYITWFAIGFVLQLLYFKYEIGKSNNFTIVLFLVLLSFFGILNITL